MRDSGPLCVRPGPHRAPDPGSCTGAGRAWPVRCRGRRRCATLTIVQVRRRRRTWRSTRRALRQLRKRVTAGGAERYHAANAAQGQALRPRAHRPAGRRGLLRRGRPATPTRSPTACPPTGWSPASATIDGRPVCLMANDSTVKAGSWGARTVEKIIRIIERAYGAGVPMVYLVDSAGARITDQVDLFPGRRGAGRIFRNQVRASGSIPQVCALFGPSRGRWRLHPGVLRRGRDGRRQRLDVPRLRPHGRDGHRREDHARGDGRRPGALRRVRRRALPLQDRGRRAGRRCAATCPTCRRTGAVRRRPPRRWPRRRRSTSPPWCRRASGRPSTCAGYVKGCSTRARSSRSRRSGPRS